MILRKVFSSYTFRFMSGYVAGLSVAVFLVLAAIYVTFSYGYFSDVHAAVQSRLDELSEAYQRGGEAAAQRYIDARLENDNLSRFYYLVVDQNFRRLSGNLDTWPHTIQHAAGWLSFELEALRRGDDALGAEFIARSERLPNGHHVLVARHYGDVIFGAKLVGGALVRSMVATILLGAIGGAIVAGVSVKRIDVINRSLKRIMSGDLSERIPVGNSGGDYRDLTLNLNRMLDRIESLMQGVRQVSDNIAHDLRTPLTRLRNHLADLQERVDPTENELVQRLLDESDSLLATFNALLRIAQVESGNRRSGFGPVELPVLLEDVVELYEPLAADKEVRLTSELLSVPPVMGDRDLLFQAFTNLLDNAIKYTPAQGDIELRLSVVDQAAQIDVSDSGPGIPEAEREKVFRRFYRVETSRSRQPGNGLGLSLVQAVVLLHGGSIELADNRPGLRVLVSLPLPDAPDEQGP